MSTPEESPQQTVSKASTELLGRGRTVTARKPNRVTQDKTGSERLHYPSYCGERGLGEALRETCGSPEHATVHDGEVVQVTDQMNGDIKLIRAA